MDMSTTSTTIFMTVTETSTVPETQTTTFTEPPDTVTVTATPETTTRTVTTSVPESPSLSYWATPSHYASLDYFDIKNFPSGRDNLDTVDRIPDWASKSSNDDKKRSMLQIFYPAMYPEKGA